MNAKFWPSFKLIAMVKVALKILHSFRKRTFLDIFEEIKKSSGYYSKVSSAIQTLLPSSRFSPAVKKQISGIVRALDLEFARWLQAHAEVLVGADLDYSKVLCWHSYGVINKLETAKILVQDENIEIKRRFVLACKYFFEDHAHALWVNISDEDKIHMAGQYCSLACMKFWMTKLYNRDMKDSIEMFHNTTDTESFSENYLGLRYYFKKLEPRARYQCLSYGLKEGEIHHFDLYLCFAELTINEVRDLLHRLSASKRVRVMELFLNFPLQSIFVEVVHQSWIFIPKHSLRNLLHIIFHERVQKSWYDINYAQLAKELWECSPFPYKSSLRRDKIYEDLILFTVCFTDWSHNSS
ncbi:uncharacterized protein TNCT_511221 [Trichonephila clavata]|uniref:Uncharacterized protein n=1 Tax=Trichonephila clavata TaxID=2740835 RepID=A0A8X6HG47_TRICU|nr:uncharacterized protein TNCT_511221 [Trichonephila clavata]